MGFFDHLQKKGTGAIQAQKSQIRKVESKSSLVRSSSVPSHLSTSKPKSSSISQPALKRTVTSPKGGSSNGSRGELKLKQRSKSTLRKRPSTVQRLYSSSDESDSDGSLDIRLSKRVKVSASAEPDLKRRVRSESAFSETGGASFSMVHAANITTVEKSKFENAFGCTEEPASISLQYPSVSQRERYQLVVSREKDGFRPLDDITQVVDMVSQNYIPEAQLSIFNDETTGIKRCLRRALTQGDLSEFQGAIKKYNKIVEQLRSDGSISKHLDTTNSLSLPLIERILTQVYSRIVSPRVESLRHYENGTDNVYGELLPRFISDIFKKTHLKSDQIFVDLGSGVGNVVLQAALETGCESWGCEMMQNACDLAKLQQAEFEARCRLWGLSAGDVHLIKGDFLDEDGIGEALRKADVVLINNQAFTPETNNKLINHFLDMKEGCQIVSLKSFVPAGHKIQARNLNSPVNLLSVEEHNYWSDCVSWTNAGGSYFIATKDSSRLRAFSDTLF